MADNEKWTDAETRGLVVLVGLVLMFFAAVNFYGWGGVACLLSGATLITLAYLDKQRNPYK